VVIREREMASLTVPPMPTSPRQDAIDLYKAFKGFSALFTYISSLDLILHPSNLGSIEGWKKTKILLLFPS
jgi:hypothetical protein